MKVLIELLERLELHSNQKVPHVNTQLIKQGASHNIVELDFQLGFQLIYFHHDVQVAAE